jgi:hypothetical protein
MNFRCILNQLKPNHTFLTWLGIVVTLTIMFNLAFQAQAAPLAQETPEPTNTRPPVFERPVVVLNGYNTNPSPVNPGQDFDLSMEIYNAGETSARNIVLGFDTTDFLPRNTGGVLAVSNIFPGNRQGVNQPLTASGSLAGQSLATLIMNVSYTDEAGNTYTEKFTLTIPLNVFRGVAATATSTPTATPTVTPAPLQRPQLVITGYESDVNPLQPGINFKLNLRIENLGNAIARRVTMIVGGGSSLNESGTPEPGVSGAGGEFTNFAPLGSSNIQSLGEVAPGGTLQAVQSLIVNVNTNPGAYPMKISFVYTSENGSPVLDEQVITLLVYSLPSVDISFYRDPGPLFIGQPNMLPIQIINLSRKSTVLGNLRVTAPNGFTENNVILIGTLDSGGYYTLDATYYPDTPGPVDLDITVDYTDDFGQARQISRTLPVEVIEFIPPEEPFPTEGDPGILVPETTETIWQKLWRFILGMIGLDSGQPQDTPENMFPQEEVPAVEGGNSPPLKGP